MTILDTYVKCLRDISPEAIERMTVGHHIGDSPIYLDGCVVWLDIETTGLNSEVDSFVLGQAIVWPATGAPYILDIRSSLAAGTQQQAAGDCPVRFNLRMTNCAVLAFNIAFERSWCQDGADTSNLWFDVANLLRRVTEPPTGMYKLADYVQHYLGKELDKGLRDDVIAQTAEVAALAHYCWLDVLVMAELWFKVQKYYFQLCPTDWSPQGQLLASSMVTHLLDWPAYLERTQQTEDQMLAEVMKDLDARLDVVRQASPAWFAPCPRKKDAKAAWLNSLEIQASPDIANLIGVSFVSLSCDSTSAAKLRANVNKMGLKSKALALFAGVDFWDTQGNKYPVVLGDGEWVYLDAGGYPQPLLNSKGAPVTGNSPFTKDMPTFSQAEYDESGELVKPSRAGIVCHIPKLHSYLTSTAFWRSIKKRAFGLSVREIGAQARRADGQILNIYRHLPAPQINGTYTGRSIDPFWLVLANWKKNKLASDIKQRVVARPGYRLVRFDFSAQELRIMLYINGRYGVENWGWEPHYLNSEFAISEATGVKELGTDSHTVFGKKIGQAREAAKQCSYCVPLSAEALVKGRGWVSRDGLEVGDLILTHNTLTGLNEWQPVLALNDFEQQPTFRMWNAKGWDVVTTENHRWFGDRRRDHGNKGRLNTQAWFTTGQFDKEHRILQAAPLTPNEPNSSVAQIVNKYDFDSAWAKLVTLMTPGELWSFYNAAISADGSVSPRNYNLPGWGSDTFTQNVDKQPGFFDAVVLAGYLLGFNVFPNNAGKKGKGMKYCKFGRVPTRGMVSMKVDPSSVQDVWCPTTANQTWVMRQGDTVTITGNSLQFGGGIRTLTVNSGLSLEVAAEAIDGYRGIMAWRENWLGEPVQEYQDGLTSGYASYCLGLTPETAVTMLNGCRPRRAQLGLSQLTLNNFPVQSCGVDMRDRLLVKLYRRIADRLGWPLVMVLHDEQVFEIPDSDVDWFSQQLTEAHAELYLELHEAAFGNKTGCPQNHWLVDGLEVYGSWRKEYNHPDNLDGGYVWKPADEFVDKLQQLVLS